MRSPISLAMVSVAAHLGLLSGDESSQRDCRERSRPIQTEIGDLYTLIDATLAQKLTLQCHYCEENDDARPKVWYKIDKLGASAPHEVRLGMSNDPAKNRVHVNGEHSLVIRNFTADDTGLYYCRRFEGEQPEEKYNYLVDLVYSNGTADESGNLTAWRSYHDEYFAPVNELFANSQGVEFRHVRGDLAVEMELITQWRPWGICEVCGRPQNEAIRKKTGLCRIKLTHKGPTTNNNNSNSDEEFLVSANAVACRSQILGRILPGISNLTRIIPNFVQIQPCDGICNPDAENQGWKTGKSSTFKYKKTVVLDEDSHFTTTCPESTLDNAVVWRRNGKVLEPGEGVEPPDPNDQPRILVDTFNTLYLIGVKESEEGNYTCQVDDIRMQQIRVYVVTKAKLLTHTFVRYTMYLGLILSLTLPCYCGGLVIACRRRRFFKDYEQLREENTKKDANAIA